MDAFYSLLDASAHCAEGTATVTVTVPVGCSSLRNRNMAE